MTDIHINAGFKDVRVIGNTVMGRCKKCDIREDVEGHRCPSPSPSNPLPDHVSIEYKTGYAVLTPKTMLALFALDDTFPHALWMGSIVAIPKRQLGSAVAAVSKYIADQETS